MAACIRDLRKQRLRKWFKCLTNCKMSYLTGFSLGNEECGRCWNMLRLLSARHQDGVYRNDGNSNTDLLDEDGSAQLARRFPSRLFRSSSSIDCDLCFDDLKSLVRKQEEREPADLGGLIKRTMLNNGWVK